MTLKGIFCGGSESCRGEAWFTHKEWRSVEVSRVVLAVSEESHMRDAIKPGPRAPITNGLLKKTRGPTYYKCSSSPCLSKVHCKWYGERSELPEQWLIFCLGDAMNTGPQWTGCSTKLVDLLITNVLHRHISWKFFVNSMESALNYHD